MTQDEYIQQHRNWAAWQHEQREPATVTPEQAADIKRLWNLGLKTPEIQSIHPGFFRDEIIAIVRSK